MQDQLESAPELRLDVSDAVPVTVLRTEPPVGLPPGRGAACCSRLLARRSYSRKYWDAEVSGCSGESFANHVPNEGFGVVVLEPLGVGARLGRQWLPGQPP